MTFTNIALAFGALAFVIPLTIHLFYRSRFTTVDWGAMHLLDSVIRVNRRRMQVSNWLLLLLRCLIPVLLAFCLAAPLLTGCRALQGDAPTSLILVVDDSRSMSAATDNGRSPMGQAKQQLKALMGHLTRRDEVLLVRGSRIGAPASSMGVSNAIKRLTEIRPIGGPVEVGRLLEAGIDASANARHPNRRVLIVSDFQSNSVGPATLETANRMAAAKLDAAAQPTFSFLNLGGNADELRNVSVDSVEVDSPAVVAGRTARFSARIRNASDLPANDLRVIWSIDGQALQPRMVSLGPRSSITNRLSRSIDDFGLHQVTVAVEHGDAISDDNRRSIAVEVLDEIKVVIVDGKPGNEPLEGQSDFLSIALSPFAFGGDDQPDPVRAEVITEPKFLQNVEEDRPEIVVLAGVGKLNDATKSWLTEFVTEGGSLVVFDGESTDPGLFNQPWTSGENEIRFPARLGEISGGPNDADAEVMKFGLINDQYSAWRLLTADGVDPFEDVEMRAFRKLVPDVEEDDAVSNDVDPENDAFEADLQTPIVLLSDVGGNPLMLRRDQGDGQIIQFGIPANDSWTNLPLRLVYLPMMQQMILDLAGKNDSVTIEVGQPIAVPVDQLASDELDVDNEDVNVKTQRENFTIETPDGDFAIDATVPDHNAGDNDDETLVWTATYSPGVYRIRKTVTDITKSNDDPIVTTTMRVVEVSPTESQLRDVEPSRLANVSSTLEANVYTDAFDFHGDEQISRFGRPIWRWFLAALLVVLIAEVWLQQNLIRRSGYARVGS